MSEGKATARAHPNIALVKYWGKRDPARILPHQSSFSLTLAPLEVATTVQLGVRSSEVELNGRPARASERERVLGLLAEVEHEAGRPLGAAKVVSRGNFPMAAGLASSAAGFAALALAVRAAAGLPRDVAATSRLARSGSGSASRSVQGGFCTWHRGTQPDGRDSFATQDFPEAHWVELRLLACIVSQEEKEVSSRDGMQSTVDTSPYYPAWTADAEAEVPRAREAVARRDLETLGALAERNAWRMHATALAADPPLCYLRPATLALILSLTGTRARGLPVWFTLDAGPNPVLLTTAPHLRAAEALARKAGATEVVRCAPGGDATLVETHLF
ncbi:MAG TPA: diphosphomevalonate decarboxylase [Myxococcaceae bacterium]|nr:diphosphomevalonate decarboxylase [Myxococcaceae bacterium]